MIVFEGALLFRALMNNKKHLFGDTRTAKRIQKVTNVPSDDLSDLGCKVNRRKTTELK